MHVVIQTSLLAKGPAFANRKNLIDELHHFIGGAGTRIRAKVAGFFMIRLSGYAHGKILIAAYFDVWIHFVVHEHDIERRTMLFDQVDFQ